MTTSNLTWRDAQDVLPEATTIDDYFVGLSERATGDESEWFGNVDERKKEFSTLQEYIDNFYQDAAYPDIEMTEELARSMLAEEIQWKEDVNPSLDKVDRVYTSVLDPGNKVETIAAWGVPAWVKIFTDDSGTILGWIVHK